MIKLFSTSNCPNCRLLQDWLIERKHKFKLVKVDEDDAGQDELIANGFMSVPIVKLKSGYYGPNLNTIKRKIDLEGV